MSKSRKRRNKFYVSKNKNDPSKNQAQAAKQNARSEASEEGNEVESGNKESLPDSSSPAVNYQLDQSDCVVMFFNDSNEYIEHFERVLSKSQSGTRVNVVIKASEEVSSRKVPSNIYLYTGEVWYNIHKNRQSSGFYHEVYEGQWSKQ